MRKWREWPRWAKLLWYVAWVAGLMGELLVALNPSHVGLARVVRIYVGVWVFICGIVGLSLSFNPDLQASAGVSNPRVLLRRTGVALVAGGVLYLCLQIYLRGQPGWRSPVSTCECVQLPAFVS